MSNSQNYNYSNLDRPYDSSMVRSGGEVTVVSDLGTDNTGNTISSTNSTSGINTTTSSNSSSSGSSSGTTSSSIQTVTTDNLEDLWIKNFIKSRSYKPKSQGFLIDGLNGYIECMKLYVGNGGIIGGSLDIPDQSSNASFHVDNLGNIWSGSTTISTAPFSVTNNGVLTAKSGTIGGWTIGATTLSSSSIILDAGNQSITSSNYVSGVFGSGFHLDSNLLEVGNIACRGLIRTAVFQKDVVNVMGGNFAVLDGDVLDEDLI